MTVARLPTDSFPRPMYILYIYTNIYMYRECTALACDSEEAISV